MEFPQQFICATKEYTTYQRFVPAPYFRKTFTAGSAGCRLRVTGLGFYRVWINGRELTKGLLAPYISNPDALVYFDDYDLTPYLRPNAENTPGFQLGNGMLNAPGGATWDFDKAPFRAAPKLAFLLENGGCGQKQTAASELRRRLCILTICAQACVTMHDVRSQAGIFRNLMTAVGYVRCFALRRGENSVFVLRTRSCKRVRRCGRS